MNSKNKMPEWYEIYPQGTIEGEEEKKSDRYSIKHKDNQQDGDRHQKEKHRGQCHQKETNYNEKAQCKQSHR
jgi:hypothetical protein